jgi:hypothetical protein
MPVIQAGKIPLMHAITAPTMDFIAPASLIFSAPAKRHDFARFAFSGVYSGRQDLVI